MVVSNTFLQGDSLSVLKTLPDECVQCVVTSPPYFGLRAYLPDGHPDKPLEVGLEETPAAYVAKLVEVFREVRRVLRSDGVAWVNLGDSYASSGKSGTISDTSNLSRHGVNGYNPKMDNQVFGRAPTPPGMKPKDLLMIPARVAIALCDDGWYLRSDVIWHKTNAMPESVKDRPTKAHEYVFLLSKNERYFYDADSIKEPSVRPGEISVFGSSKGRNYTPSETDPNYRHGNEQWGRTTVSGNERNKRSVWSLSTTPYPGSHFAVMPPKLAETCIRAGSRPGDIVLDPFSGAGTTAYVAMQHGRQYIGVELNPEYILMAEKRLDSIRGLWETAI